MRCLGLMLFGTGLLSAACGGGAGTSRNDQPGPTPAPLGESVCAKQHDDYTDQREHVVVCDELYPEAPFVHLPADGKLTYAALVRTESGGMAFVTADGSSYPYE